MGLLIACNGPIRNVHCIERIVFTQNKHVSARLIPTGSFLNPAQLENPLGMFSVSTGLNGTMQILETFEAKDLLFSNYAGLSVDFSLLKMRSFRYLYNVQDLSADSGIRCRVPFLQLQWLLEPYTDGSSLMEIDESVGYITVKAN